MLDTFDQIIQSNTALNEQFHNLVEFVKADNLSNIWWCNFWLCFLPTFVLVMWVCAYIEHRRKAHEADWAVAALISTLLGSFFILCASCIRADSIKEYRNPEITAKNKIIDFIQPKPIK